MKNKKALWPWAKRMVMGETKASRRHTAGSENTDAGFRDLKERLERGEFDEDCNPDR